jgi:flagellar basal body P-ring formation protein FlgA
MLKMITALSLTFLLGATSLAAQQMEDVGALDAQIAATTGAEIGAPGGAAQPVDRRLKLARCSEALDVAPSPFGDAIVRCKSLGWRIRVPLVQGAQGIASGEMLVKRGESVDLVIGGNGFEVSVAATALEDGGLGKPIRVKTPTAAAAIVATVYSRGVVRISR